MVLVVYMYISIDLGIMVYYRMLIIHFVVNICMLKMLLRGGVVSILRC